MSFWDQRYAEAELAYGAEPNDFLKAEAHRLPPGPLLALAEGQGRNALFLAGLGREVTALDASAVGMARAAELAAAAGVPLQTVVADLATWEGQPGAYAGIVSIFGHLPPAVRARVHAGIPRWLKPGGILLMEAYSPAQLALGTGGPSDLGMLYAAADLAREFAGLEILSLRELEREVVEGRYHTGRAAVTQLIARKPIQGG